MTRQLLSGLSLAIAILASGADALECSAGRFDASFDTGPVDSAFAATQKQNGTVETAQDPAIPGNRAALLTAGAKTRGRVGKADLIHRFAPVGAGSIIKMEGRFFFPEGAAIDSVILMDLECASCGVDTNPGIRLYLRDGRLRVDRSKIGIKEPFYPAVATQVKTGQWQTIGWTVDLGIGEAGRSHVTLDGETISDQRGTTLLSQQIVSKLADIRVNEQVDRFQVGLTANSNNRKSQLLMDDIVFCLASR